MNNRELVIDVMNKLPEDAPLTLSFASLNSLLGSKRGIAAADRGDVMTLEELEVK